MSLKHNPFDQTPKGNLVKRRRVFETPVAESKNHENSGSSISNSPSRDSSSTKLDNIVSEHSSRTDIKNPPSESHGIQNLQNNVIEQKSEIIFDNNILKQDYGTKLPNKYSEQKSETTINNLVSEHSSSKQLDNIVLEHSSGTLVEAPISGSDRLSNPSSVIPAICSGTLFPNTVLEQSSESLVLNSDRVQAFSSKTKYQNKPFVSEQVPIQSSETSLLQSNNVPEHNSGTNPLFPSINPLHEEHIDLSSDEVIDLTANKIEPIKNFSKLIGLKKRIITFIYDECLKHKTKSLKTTYDQLSISVSGDKESVRTTIKRLNKGPLSYFSVQSLGRGPGSQIIIRTQEIDLREYMSYRVTTNNSSGALFQNFIPEHRKDSRTSSETTPSSSSSDINNKNTTNTKAPEPKGQEIPEEWLDIQTPENVKAIGFGQTQIKQLFQLGTLSASEVQESLDAFAYDLEVGKVNSRGSKLGFLMGILRRSGAYISEGLVNELKVQVENNEKRRREMADLEKRQAQDKLTAKAQEIASHMTEREKLSLVPENGLVKIGSVSHERLVMAKIVEGLSKS